MEWGKYVVGNAKDSYQYEAYKAGLLSRSFFFSYQ